MENTVWLEVALNGPWSRDYQPLIPLSADEIVEDAIACAEAGAPIIHFHAYDPVTGRQRDDYEIYAPIIERIKSKVDVICYPTIPFAGHVDASATLSPGQRFDAVEKLLKAGLIEWIVVDPGSTNITHFSGIAEGREGFIYANPEAHIRYGLSLAQKHNATPSYAIYEPGFLRLGAALHKNHPGAPNPIYRFMFSGQLSFGFPPEEWALEAYLKLLDRECADAPWMIAGLGVEIAPLIDMAVDRGGHVRVGLEDAPFGAAVENLSQVKRTIAKIVAQKRPLATTADVRTALRSKLD
ncbi:MAG: 3-keto-5-aminohexanoate cleavage protein [Hyphomicrobiaceae bacterium]